MPQFVIVGAVLVGGWCAWRALKRAMTRIDREMEAARSRPAETLQRDPATGRYKLREKE